MDAVPHLFEVDDLRDEPLSNITGANPNDYTYLEHLYTKDQPKTYELVRSWRDILDMFAKGEGSDERVSIKNETKNHYQIPITLNLKVSSLNCHYKAAI